MAELYTVCLNLSWLFENADMSQGVNTGVGVNSNTRTRHVEQLQASLVSMVYCGIIYSIAGRQSNVNEAAGYLPDLVCGLEEGLLVEDPILTNCMPEFWVRAAMLIRINSLIHGVSSVRSIIVERLTDLLRKKVISWVPIFGSISASGDLCSLSYIAGAL